MSVQRMYVSRLQQARRSGPSTWYISAIRSLFFFHPYALLPRVPRGDVSLLSLTFLSSALGASTRLSRSGFRTHGMRERSRDYG